MALIDVCPVCDAPGGWLFGIFHDSCYFAALGIEEATVHEQYIVDSVPVLLAAYETYANALRQIMESDGDLVAMMTTMTALLATIHHDTGQAMQTMHTMRKLVIARRSVVN